jgi:hypothetical protein
MGPPPVSTNKWCGCNIVLFFLNWCECNIFIFLRNVVNVTWCETTNQNLKVYIPLIQTQIKI